MKKELDELWADIKKTLSPKMIIFIIIGIAAFIIHPLIGLIFAGVGINFLMSFYTSMGVLDRKSSEDEVVQEENP